MPHLYSRIVSATIATLALILLSTTAVLAGARSLRPGDIQVPDGFRIEVAVDNLGAPTMVAFDDQDRMLIAESGYNEGGESGVTRIEPDGSRTVLASGPDFAEEVPVTTVGFFEDKVYVVHGGTVSIIEEPHKLKNIITGIPHGDHQANQIIFKDGKLYLAVGTVTNSGVVGPDNAVFGWLKYPNKKNTADVPCQDITLSGAAAFESENVLGDASQKVKTSAYAPFGTELPPGSAVKGNIKCNGAILRANPDGSGLEMYAWGLRNPYGLEIGPGGTLYATMHGFDARGSRPIENAWDCLYKVDQGAWYGWPDFACEAPVTDSRFATQGKPQPQFLLASHPASPAAPIAKFNPHAAANGFAFAPSPTWGSETEAFVALFGDFTPATGTVDTPQGVKVVKVNTQTGEVTDFISNKLAGQASRHSAGGLEHPSDVTFGPDGAMYIADWGVARVSDEGLKLEPNTGVVWKVYPAQNASQLWFGPSGIINLLIVVGLLAAAAIALGVFSGSGKTFEEDLWTGAKWGAVAGLAMGLLAFVISGAILKLPWYAPARVFAFMVMGRRAFTNVLEFELAPFIAGVFVLVVLTVILGSMFTWVLRKTERSQLIIAGALYGLAVWGLLQYFVLPLTFPIVTEKGFPPEWYAVCFAFYGLALGWLASHSLGRSKVRP